MEVEPFVAWLRGQPRLFTVPVVVMVARVCDDSFNECHAAGADDVIDMNDEDGITRRLQALSGFDPKVRPPANRGRAVIGCPDEARRRILGRILRVGGFDVGFAATAEELVDQSAAGEPALLVLSDNLPQVPVLVEKARSAVGTEVPSVVLASRRRCGELLPKLRTLRSAIPSPEHRPPDNLLFLANELLNQDATNQRDSARLLRSAVC
ncbi:MAG: hypothetical protein AAGF12_43795, partial [Myxococcota bacterium]